jgi:hypothetical protein
MSRRRGRRGNKFKVAFVLLKHPPATWPLLVDAFFQVYGT